ncbi:hypothetical protein PRIPAC_93039, partial [Pristionchus pacificus]
NCSMDGQSADASRPSLQDRLKQLGEVERNIDLMLRNAQTCMVELAREKQPTKNSAQNKMDDASQNFRAALNFVESTLSSNMAYLSNVCVGTPHQGSTFSAHHKMGLAAQCEQSLHSELASLNKFHFHKEADRVSQDEEGQMDSLDSSNENSVN